jgi:hypothetical protein
VQKVRWDNWGTEEQVINIFSMEKETKIITCEQGFLYTTQ